MRNHLREHADRLETLLGHAPPEAFAGPDELKQLVGVAVEVRRALSPAAPPAATRARVWARLEPKIAASAFPARRPALILRPAYALAGVALVLVLALGTTAAYASEASLPGDPLYPLKRGLEAASLTLSLSEEGHENLTATYADRRLSELEQLAALGRWSDARRALEAYPSVIDSFVTQADESHTSDVEQRLQRHVEVLERVRDGAPPSAQPALTKALDRAQTELEQLGGGRGPGNDGAPPGQEKKDDTSGRDAPGHGQNRGDKERRPSNRLTPTPDA